MGCIGEWGRFQDALVSTIHLHSDKKRCTICREISLSKNPYRPMAVATPKVQNSAVVPGAVQGSERASRIVVRVDQGRRFARTTARPCSAVNASRSTMARSSKRRRSRYMVLTLSTMPPARCSNAGSTDSVSIPNTRCSPVAAASMSKFDLRPHRVDDQWAGLQVEEQFAQSRSFAYVAHESAELHEATIAGQTRVRSAEKNLPWVGTVDTATALVPISALASKGISTHLLGVWHGTKRLHRNEHRCPRRALFSSVFHSSTTLFHRRVAPESAKPRINSESLPKSGRYTQIRNLQYICAYRPL